MKYPKMIMFDYGHTLLYEPDWDAVRGNAELLKYVTKNPNNCTLEDVRKGAELIFGKHFENIRKMGYDISGQVGDKVFDIALQKAGICSDEVWYCGDNPRADIEGASQAGIYPVWYDNDTDKNYRDRSVEYVPECEHLHIHTWDELIDLLERMRA